MYTKDSCQITRSLFSSIADATTCLLSLNNTFYSSLVITDAIKLLDIVFKTQTIIILYLLEILY